MVSESWFTSLWRPSRKDANKPERRVIGILAFEVVSLMSKVVALWNSVSEKQVVSLREEIIDSLGIKMLVSEDDDFLISLVFDEMMENLGFVAMSIARLGKRCTDPVYHHLEELFSSPIINGAEWDGWTYRWKKMERKVRKMKKYIAAAGQLYHELDVLSELEQAFGRMQGSINVDRVKLLEFQQKVLWQRQEVRILSDMCPWNRSYDYIVPLMARSILTVLERVKHVFGINQRPPVEEIEDSTHIGTRILLRSHSLSAPLPSSVTSSESNSSRFFSGPLGGSSLKSGLTGDQRRTNERPRQTNHQSHASQKNSHLKTKRLASVGPFKGCMPGGNNSPIVQNCKLTVAEMNSTKQGLLFCNSRYTNKLSLISSKCSFQNAPLSTLGDSGLAQHYANIIILIERLASSPHFISLDGINELYNMLPANLRTDLRARLKSHVRNPVSHAYDAAFATEWSLTLGRILEWLSPLAHNMVRWQSERNFEKQHINSRTNVLLVQTIYFANQAKTDAVISELLVGLNYVWRFGRELNEKAGMGQGWQQSL